MNITISKIHFPFYFTIVILSLFINIIYIYKSLKSDNYKDKNILLYFLMYICFALYFGKLFSSLHNPKINPLFIGFNSYGALFGVSLATFIYEKISPSNNKLIKYTILSLPLTYSISKIACFIVGCCSGIPYSGIISVTYKDYLNIPQFPIQLLESLSFLIIFIICNYNKNKKNILIKTIIISISIKGLLDFLRYEHIKQIITTNQIISIVIIIIVLIYKYLNNKGIVKL